MKPSKLLLTLALVAALIAFFAFDLGRFLTLDFIKQSQSQLAQWYAEMPLRVMASYFLIYVAVTALSLPGAAIMTLAGGAVFGLGLGLLLVSFASTIGATLAFLSARFVLRDAMQKKFVSRMAEINQGVAKDGAFYLFTLRLVPLVPFFVINVVMGLTTLKVRTFFWVSQLGMLLGTAVFVNAGTQLAKIDSLNSILTPVLIGSFVLLGLFPLLAKKLLALLKQRKVYAQWNHLKPTHFDRNLVVIGGGAAGLVSAYIAAAVKAKVTLVEAHKMGGDCLNYGCVPSKALIKSAKLAHQIKHASQYGLTDSNPSFSFKSVMQRITQVIAAIEPHDSVERYTKLGVEVLEGYATIVNPWTVQIKLNDGTQQTLTTRSIIIAAGASPVIPAIVGIEQSGFVTSDTLWDTFAQLDAVPANLVVLGGGPIGCELAQSFARLGSHVTQIEQAPRLLAREDEDVSNYAMDSLKSDGVTILCGHQTVRFESGATGKAIIVTDGTNEKSIPYDHIICAVGRRARLSNYGLETLGIPTQRTIDTNEYLATVFPNIFAAGDVAGPYQFTHMAAHQAWYAAVNALFGWFKQFKVDYRLVPAATFIDPEVARVGLNESEAKAQGIVYEVTRYGIDDLDRAIADSQAHGFVKVLTVPGKDTILGVTIVGSHASDLLAEFVLTMKHGLGLNKILGTIHTYPTLAEANKYVAGEWKRAHQPHALLAWVKKYHDWQRS
jgi:pyruvate/2-oxoglutarate dehydrogenase complex dihydrolipoamide dehydrogenase (E3) component/uncharacterized membrane protein YdjX (TVP38/TMEM64 family)